MKWPNDSHPALRRQKWLSLYMSRVICATHFFTIRNSQRHANLRNSLLRTRPIFAGCHPKRRPKTSKKRRLFARSQTIPLTPKSTFFNFLENTCSTESPRRPKAPELTSQSFKTSIKRSRTPQNGRCPQPTKTDSVSRRR